MSSGNKKINTLIEPKHSIADYIHSRLKSYNWTIKGLSNYSSISQGEISKILNGTRKGLKASIFYNLYTAFGDTCEKATKTVYPNLELKLNKYIPKARNTFGKFMEQFETINNSLEEIAIKTGIDENRLKDLYYRRAALEAYELLLIEKAVGKKQGQLFEELFKS